MAAMSSSFETETRVESESPSATFEQKCKLVSERLFADLAHAITRGFGAPRFGVADGVGLTVAVKALADFEEAKPAHLPICEAARKAVREAKNAKPFDEAAHKAARKALMAALTARNTFLGHFIVMHWKSGDAHSEAAFQMVGAAIGFEFGLRFLEAQIEFEVATVQRASAAVTLHDLIAVALFSDKMRDAVHAMSVRSWAADDVSQRVSLFEFGTVLIDEGLGLAHKEAEKDKTKPAAELKRVWNKCYDDLAKVQLVEGENALGYLGEDVDKETAKEIHKALMNLYTVSWMLDAFRADPFFGHFAAAFPALLSSEAADAAFLEARDDFERTKTALDTIEAASDDSL